MRLRSLVLASLALAAACAANPADPSDDSGTLEVNTRLTVGAPSLPGFTLAVDDIPERSLAPDGAIRLTGLSAGTHQLRVSGGGPGCTVAQPNPRSVLVAAKTVVRTTFEIACGVAGLVVQVATEGGSPDPDGYLVSVTGETSRGVATDGQVIYDALPPGTYTVYLTGLAPNCIVLGPATQTVTLAPGSIAHLDIQVGCPTLAPGSLLVGVSTRTIGTGWSLSFSLLVDDRPAGSVPTNGYVIISPIAAGTHSVKLVTNYPGSCFISGGQQMFSGLATVTVPPGGFGRQTYGVLCVP